MTPIVLPLDQTLNEVAPFFGLATFLVLAILIACGVADSAFDDDDPPPPPPPGGVL